MLPGRRHSGVTTIDDCDLLPAGKDWDAIRVAEDIAQRAMEILGARSGAVVEDPRSRTYYWFVTVGTAADWDLPGTKGLGEHRHVGIPPHGKVAGPGLRWRVTPGDGRLITDSGPLRAAIEDALAQEGDSAPATEPAGGPVISARCLAACVSHPDQGLSVDGQLLHDRCALAGCACPRHQEAL